MKKQADRLSSILLFLFVCQATMVFGQTRSIQPITIQQKLALVVGNARYPRSPLVNPLRDAESVAAELQGLGFGVALRSDLSLREFSRAVDEFAGRLQTGDLAIFYYSGHGMQVGEENYLLPIDFDGATESDVPYTAYSANRVRDKLERSGARLRIIILDACRDNPYKSSKGGPSGLAPMGSTAEGTLIAFATGDNHTASDNPGQRNGLFTQHLLSALHEPGLEMHELFKRVKEEVYYGSNKTQNPFTYDDVAGSYYFRPNGTAVNTPLPSPPSVSGLDAAAEAWALIKNSTNPEDFDEFARSFAASDLAATARMHAAQLRRSIAVRTPAPSPSLAQELVAEGVAAYSRNDFGSAMKFYRQAADGGDARAIRLVGYLYYHGQGTRQDYAEAMRWWRKAESLGDTTAMYLIGSAYADGKGVPQDFGEAMRWYLKSSTLGDANGMGLVASLYFDGAGVKQNYSEAMLWFRKAADGGSSYACYWVARMYDEGLGVSKNRTEAIAWYRKGAERGNTPSKDRLEVLLR